MTFDLKYAKKMAGVWAAETVTSMGDVGSYSSLALDAQGNPHISYFDATGEDLEYATKSGGVWTLETVQGTDSPSQNSSIDIDTQGNPCIAYWDGMVASNDLRYASKRAGVWTIETVDRLGDVGTYSSLELDDLDNPHISYRDATQADLKYTTRKGGRWITETVETVGNVGLYTSIALDSQGQPRIAHLDNTNFDLRYASAAIEMSAPLPDDDWQVGANETVAWEGTGRLDFYLSADGGNSWTLEQSGLGGGQASFLVPHVPSRFARVKLERAVPHYEAVTPGFISIETSISLLNFVAQVDPEGGATLSWNTDPGPSELAGYRLERGAGGSYSTIVPLTRETSYHDPAGTPGSQYRLFAVNGLGEELMLGETSLLPPRMLAAWPMPYRDGALHVSFGVAGVGGAAGRADVALYDLSGRRVRTLASGPFESGYHVVQWDGRDDRGGRVPVGIYFLRSSTAGETARIKLVVMP